VNPDAEYHAQEIRPKRQAIGPEQHDATVERRLMEERIALGYRVPYWLVGDREKPRWRDRPRWRLRALAWRLGLEWRL
jgi:hypothetical protein